MDINEFITRIIEVRGVIIAIKGNKSKVYTQAYLTRCWLTMRNDSFYHIFGFNWIPTLTLQVEIRKNL